MTDQLCACGCGREPKAGKRFIHGHQVGRGPEHMNWRGGRSRHPGGYVSVLQPDGSHQLEHIVVAERALGRPLPSLARVHHLNGDRADNRPANLVICESHAYHMLLHKRQRALDACGDPSAQRCVFCGGYGDDDMTVLQLKDRTRAYHRACNAAAVRAFKARRNAS